MPFPIPFAIGFMTINLINHSQPRKLLISGLHACYIPHAKDTMVILILHSYPFFDETKITIDVRDAENKLFRARKYAMLFFETSDRQNIVVLTKANNFDSLPQFREKSISGSSVQSANGSFFLDFRFMQIAEGKSVDGWEYIYSICNMLGNSQIGLAYIAKIPILPSCADLRIICFFLTFSPLRDRQSDI